MAVACATDAEVAEEGPFSIGDLTVIPNRVKLNLAALCEVFDNIVKRYVDGIPTPILYCAGQSGNCTLSLRHCRTSSANHGLSGAVEMVPLLQPLTSDVFLPLSTLDTQLGDTTPTERIAASYSISVGFFSPRRFAALVKHHRDAEEAQAPSKQVVAKQQVIALPKRHISPHGGALPLAVFLQSHFHNKPAAAAAAASCFITEKAEMPKSARCRVGGKWQPCQVVEMDPNGLMFSVEIPSGPEGVAVSKTVSRAALLLPGESEEEHHQLLQRARVDRARFEREMRFELFVNLVDDDPHGSPIPTAVLHRILKKGTMGRPPRCAETVSRILTEIQHDCSHAMRMARAKYLLLHPHHQRLLAPLALEVPQETGPSLPANAESGVDRERGQLQVHTGVATTKGISSSRQAVRRQLEKQFSFIPATAACLSEMRSLWHSRFSLLALVDLRRGTAEGTAARALVDDCRIALHAGVELLRMQYLPELDTIMMMRLQGVYSYSFPSVQAFESSQLAQFFKVVHVEASLRFRGVVERSLAALRSFFNVTAPSAPALYESATDRYYRCPGSKSISAPRITLTLDVRDDRVVLLPTLDSFTASMHGVVNDMISSVNGLPRVECLALTALGYPRREFACLFGSEDFIEGTRQQILRAVADARPFVEQLASAYGTYCTPFEPPSRETLFSSCDTSALSEQLIGTRKVIEHLMWCSPASVPCGIFAVDCGTVKNALLRRWQDIESQLVKHLVDHIVELAAATCKQFEDVEIRLRQRPVDAEGLHSLKMFAADARAAASRVDCEVYPRLLDWVEVTEEHRIVLPQDVVALLHDTFSWQQRMRDVLLNSDRQFDREREVLVGELLRSRQAVLKDLGTFAREIDALYAMSEMDQVSEAVQKIAALQPLADRIAADVDRLHIREKILDVEVSSFGELHSLQSSFEALSQFWTTVSDSTGGVNGILETPITQLDVDAVVETAERWRRLLRAATRRLRGYPEVFLLGRRTEAMLANFQCDLPLLQMMMRPGLRIIHWKEISRRIGVPSGKELLPTDPTVLVQTLLATFQNSREGNYLQVIEEVALQATREHEVAASLDAMKAEARSVRLHFTLHGDESDHRILNNAHEISAVLDHFVASAQQLRLSPFIGSLSSVAQDWESHLVRMQETLSVWTSVQEEWLQLSPIIHQSQESGSLSGAILREFKEADAGLCAMLEELDKPQQSLHSVITFESLPHRLAHIAEVMHRVRANVLLLMDAKRRIFPRFFFVSNQDMLACLSLSNMDGVLSLLPSMYTHLRRFDMSRGEVTAFVSVDGVTIKNDRQLTIGNEPVEMWMSKMDDALQRSLRKALKGCLADFAKSQLRQWIFKWSAQHVDLVCKISLTAELAEVIQAAGHAGLTSYARKVARLLDEQFRMTTIEELTKAERIVLANLMSHQLHVREIVEHMIADGASSVEQLAGYPLVNATVDNDGDVTLEVFQTRHRYGFEFMGNVKASVVHASNFKAIRTLLLLNATGSSSLLLGPAGSGKSETAVECSTLLGRMMCMIHSDSTLRARDYLSPLKACAAIGAVMCFENVETLAAPTLTALKVGLTSLFDARRKSATVFDFADEQVTLNTPNGGPVCIATTSVVAFDKIPNAVTLVFRPIALQEPDFEVFARIFLSANGFHQSAFALGTALGSLFRCGTCVDQATFNLRSLRRILDRATELRFAADDADCVVIAVKEVINPANGVPACVALVDEWLTQFSAADAPSASSDFSLPESMRPSVEDQRLVLLFGPPFSGKRERLESFCRSNGGAAVARLTITASALLSSEVYQCGSAIPPLLEAIVRANADVVVLSDLRASVCEWWMLLFHSAATINPHALPRETHTVRTSSQTRVVVRNESIVDLSPSVVSRFVLVPCGQSRTWNAELSRMNADDAVPALPCRDVAVPVLHLLFSALEREEELRAAVGFDSMTCLLHAAATLGASLAQSVAETRSALQSIIDGQQISPALSMKTTLLAFAWSVGGPLEDTGKWRVEALIRSCADELSTILSPHDANVEVLPPPANPGDSLPSIFAHLATASGWKPAVERLQPPHLPAGLWQSLADVWVPTWSSSCVVAFAQAALAATYNVVLTGGAGSGKSVVLKHLSVDGATSHHFGCTPSTTVDLLFSTLQPHLVKRKSRVWGPHVGKKLVLMIDDVHVGGFSAQLTDGVAHLVSFRSITTTMHGPLQLVDAAMALASTPTYWSACSGSMKRHFVQLKLPDPPLSSFHALLTAALEASNINGGSLVPTAVVEASVHFAELVHKTVAMELGDVQLRDLLLAGDRLRRLLELSCPDHSFKQASVSEVYSSYVFRFGSRADVILIRHVTQLIQEAFGGDSLELSNIYCAHTNKSVDVVTLDDAHRRFNAVARRYNNNEIFIALRADEARRVFTPTPTAVTPVCTTTFFFQYAWRLTNVISTDAEQVCLLCAEDHLARELTQFASAFHGVPFYDLQSNASTDYAGLFDELVALMRFASKGDRRIVVLVSSECTTVPHTLLALNTLLEDKCTWAEALYHRHSEKNSSAPDTLAGGPTDVQVSPKHPGSEKCGITIVLNMQATNSVMEVRKSYPFATNAPSITVEKQSDAESQVELAHSIIREHLHDDGLAVRVANAAVNIVNVLVGDEDKSGGDEDVTRFTAAFAHLFARMNPMIKAVARHAATLQMVIDNFRATNLRQQRRKDELVPLLEHIGSKISDLEKKIDVQSVVVDQLKAEFDALENSTVATVSAIEAKKHAISQLRDSAAARLEEARQALRNCDLKQITALRLTISPPQKIKQLFEAVCTMLGERPERNTRGAAADYWTLARRLMEDPDFVDRLTSVSVDSPFLPGEEKLRSAAATFENHRFTSVSPFAQGMADLVQAVIAALEAKQQVTELESEIAESRVTMLKVVDDLEIKRDDLNKATETRQHLRDMVEEDRAQRQSLSDEAQACQQKLQNSGKLVALVKRLTALWAERLHDAAEADSNLMGNLLMSAAMLSLLGCKWPPSTTAAALQSEISKAGITCGALGTYSLQRCLSLAPPLLHHHIYGKRLPDQHNAFLGAISSRAFVHWPLLITSSTFFVDVVEQQIASSYGDCIVVPMEAAHAHRAISAAMVNGHGVLVTCASDTCFPQRWFSFLTIAARCQFEVDSAASPEILFDEDKLTRVSPNFFIAFVSSHVTLVTGIVRHFALFDFSDSSLVPEGVLNTLVTHKAGGCARLTQELVHHMRDVETRVAEIEAGLDAAAALSLQNRETLDDDPSMIQLLQDEVLRAENSKRIVESSRKQADDLLEERRARWGECAAFVSSIWQTLDALGIAPCLQIVDELVTRSAALHKAVSTAISPAKLVSLNHTMQQRAVAQSFLLYVLEVFSPGWASATRGFRLAAVMAAAVSSSLFWEDEAEETLGMRIAGDEQAISSLKNVIAARFQHTSEPLLAFVRACIGIVFTNGMDQSTPSSQSRAMIHAASATVGGKGDLRISVHHCFYMKIPILALIPSESEAPRAQRFIQRYILSLDRAFHAFAVCRDTPSISIVNFMQQLREGADCVLLTVSHERGSLRKVLELLDKAALGSLPPLWLLCCTSCVNESEGATLSSICRRCVPWSMENPSIGEHVAQLIALGPAYRRDWRDTASGWLRVLLNSSLLYHAAMCVRHRTASSGNFVEDDDLSIFLGLLKLWKKRRRLELVCPYQVVCQVLQLLYGSKVSAPVEQARVERLVSAFIPPLPTDSDGAFKVGGLVPAVDWDLGDLPERLQPFESSLDHISGDPEYCPLHAVVEEREVSWSLLPFADPVLDCVEGSGRTAHSSVSAHIASELEALRTVSDLTKLREVWLPALRNPRLLVERYMGALKSRVVQGDSHSHMTFFILVVPCALQRFCSASDTFMLTLKGGRLVAGSTSEQHTVALCGIPCRSPQTLSNLFAESSTPEELRSHFAGTQVSITITPQRLLVFGKGSSSVTAVGNFRVILLSPAAMPLPTIPEPPTAPQPSNHHRRRVSLVPPKVKKAVTVKPVDECHSTSVQLVPARTVVDILVE